MFEQFGVLQVHVQLFSRLYKQNKKPFHEIQGNFLHFDEVELRLD
jgi:hypothetical protein